MSEPDDDPVLWPHKGTWSYHDDDCRCGWYDMYCNRDGWVWSCCGSCKEHSDCSAPHMHPTHWQHFKATDTHAGWKGIRPTYRSNAEIRALAPECFPDPSEPSEAPEAAEEP